MSIFIFRSDAEIGQKGHFWTDTNYHDPRGSFMPFRVQGSINILACPRTRHEVDSHINSALPQLHGGTIIATARTLGVGVRDLLDLSSNLSPFGPPAGLLAYLQEEIWQIGVLPEIDNHGLLADFAKNHGCQTAEVLAGNGTTDFIFSLPRLLVAERAVLVQPSYNDYALACQRAGLPVAEFILPADQDFRLSLENLAAFIRPGDLVFLCNPNNPTGQLIASQLLHEFAFSHPQVNFVVDESYLPFVDEPSLVGFERLANLYILCSSSKIYGMPGLRLGFLVARAEKLAPFQQGQQPWQVNRLAQLAGHYLFAKGQSHVQRIVTYVAQERPIFAQQLRSLPLHVVPGVTNFILCRLPGKEKDALWLQNQLLNHKMMIRNCANFSGLDGSYFRVSLQQPGENTRFLERLAETLLSCV